MRTKNSQPVKRSRPLAAQAQSPGSGQHPAPSALPLQRALPRASVEKANKVFENFNLSKFPKDALPSNYVDRRKARDAAAVQTRHRELITKQLETVPERDTQNPGMMFAFRSEKLEKIQRLLPGIQQDGGTIELVSLLKYLQGKMNGTVFYSNGNPVLRRLTAETQFRSQARAIIESIKNIPVAAKSSASEPTPRSKSVPKQLASQKKGGPMP